MSSFQSRIFTSLLRLINKKSFLGRQLKAGKFSRFDCPEPPASLFHRIDKQHLSGRNFFTLYPRKENSSNGYILYLHGGAYVQCFTWPHWYFLSSLIKGTGYTVIAPDYPLAPTYTYKEAFIMVEQLYKQLIDTAGPSKFVLMGDSAGGGFALALAQKMKNSNIPMPEQIILLSPWLDISLENPAINSLEPADPFLEKESLRQAGKLYAGGTDTGNYLLSPINGPLKDLGRITIFAGSNEILVADARKLTAQAISEGIDLVYYEYPDMVHGWMFLNFPESKQAREQIVSLIRTGS